MFSRIVLLCLLFGGWQIASAGVVRIADGDCAALTRAVTIASATNSNTTVLLARGGTYSGCGINMYAGNIVIDGQGATMNSFDACVGDYYHSVNPGTALVLRNLSIVGSSEIGGQNLCQVGELPGLPEIPVYVSILNAGSLSLESVTLRNFASHPSTAYYSGYLVSSGDLTLRNVSVIGTESVNGGTLITAGGDLEIYNSTFVGNSTAASLIYFGKQGSMTVSNSLFSHNALSICPLPPQQFTARFTSLGGNVTDDSSCGFSADGGDKILQETGLGSFGNHGGLIPTQAIGGGSPAHGAGVAQYCEALDARGYTRSPHGCDAGAYEYGGGSGALTENGMNGFYYDPDANGHYVSIQRIHDNGDVAIVWSAFDANGNPAWVYGVGQLTGKRIHANMSQNIGGVLQPGGAPTGSSVRPWGTVDIDLTSCVLAQFNYASNLDGFGSGQFPLTRLAFVSDFGCAE